jgi:hypothetical protein
MRTFCLAAVHIKVNVLHFLSQVTRKGAVRKVLGKASRRMTRGLLMNPGGLESLSARSGPS